MIRVLKSYISLVFLSKMSSIGDKDYLRVLTIFSYSYYFFMTYNFLKKLTLKQWESAFIVTCFLSVSPPAIAIEPKGLPEKSTLLPGKIKRGTDGKIYLEPPQQPTNISTKKSSIVKNGINTKILYKDWVKLNWIAPSQYTNGEPLNDLAGYRIYYWTKNNSEKHVLDVKKVLSYKLENLLYGETYYFAVTAYNKNLVESCYSEIIAVKLEKPIEE